jgi:hypothetical protein
MIQISPRSQELEERVWNGQPEVHWFGLEIPSREEEQLNGTHEKSSRWHDPQARSHQTKNSEKEVS